MSSEPDFGVALPNYVGNSINKGKVEMTYPIDYAFPTNDRFSWEQLVKITRDAERLGYDSVWASDHHMLGLGNLEAWTTLAALSASASQVRLGTFVSCNNFRNPALVAKMAGTLGVISKGRFILGYGAGWYRPEYDAYGFEFADPGTRVSMLKEGLTIIRGMLHRDRFSFSGKYYRVKDAVNEPKPPEGVPIMVGGGGERIIGLAAKFGDIWDVGPDVKPEIYGRKVEVLRRELRRTGRPSDSVKQSMHFRLLVGSDEEDLARKKSEILRIVEGYDSKLGFRPSPEFRFDIEETMIGTPSTLKRRFRQYVDLGCRQFIVHFMDYPRYDSLKLFRTIL